MMARAIKSLSMAGTKFTRRFIIAAGVLLAVLLLIAYRTSHDSLGTGRLKLPVGKGVAAIARSYVELNLLDHEPDMSPLYTEKFLP